MRCNPVSYAGEEVDRVNGVKAAELTNKVRQHAARALDPISGGSPREDLNTRLKKLINAAEVRSL